MSRNAIALKPSLPRNPVDGMSSVIPEQEVEKGSRISRMGNGVRGLKDLIFDLLQEVEVLEHDELFAELTSRQRIHRPDIEEGIKFHEVVRQFEINIIRRALFITGGNQARAARLLGIKPNTLNYKIKLYEI